MSNTEQRNYKAAWIAQKRRKIQIKRKLAEANLDTDSDSSDSSQTYSAQIVELSDSAVASRKGGDFLCHRWSNSSSSDESDEQLSDNDCWDAVDRACSYCSDSSDSDSGLGKADVKSRLQAWAVECGVSHNTINKLLPIIREFDKSLPVTAKTLLKQSGEVQSQVKLVSGGDFVYLGVREGLCEVLQCKTAVVNCPDNIELSLNIDGLPLFRSSPYSLWPILCCASNIKPNTVFVVALYGGTSKPENLDFLTEAVEELKELLTEGMDVEGKHFSCTLKMCVCDAPARAMVKCVKQFSGYFGCDKCVQKGEYEGRVIYPECDAPLRDNDSFRQQTNLPHHNAVSPFCALPVDMITFFPIDYMHQLCLGVMKRLLVCWTGGTKKVKLSVAQKSAVNTKLQVFRNVVTNDFSRKPRTLNDLSHWKATEFRTFLLYIGYFVLHKIVNERLLHHFLCLSVASRILLCDRLATDSEYRSFAHDLLLYFVEQAADIYGREFLVYNVHCLVHLSKEAELFGCLDNSSAFIFENHMQVLKKHARSGRNPLTQVRNRLSEYSLYSSPKLQRSTLQCELHQFALSPPNNSCILVESGRCCQIVSKSQTCVTVMLFYISEPVFDRPEDSRIIGIHKVKLSHGVLKHLPQNILGRKAMCYPQFNADSLVFIELLHDD